MAELRDRYGLPLSTRSPDAAGYEPPSLGQHADEVLRRLGYRDDGIPRLRRRGVVR